MNPISLYYTVKPARDKHMVREEQQREEYNHRVKERKSIRD